MTDKDQPYEIRFPDIERELYLLWLKEEHRQLKKNNRRNKRRRRNQRR